MNLQQLKAMQRSKLVEGVPFLPPGGGGGGLPRSRVMGMCRWMGSHFHRTGLTTIGLHFL